MKWISVKYELPESEIVIVYTMDEMIAMARCIQISKNNYQWNNLFVWAKFSTSCSLDVIPRTINSF